ncbi:hypothetical protein FSARC_7010 [Fusarium sarcochroum]|uniref:Uncharacterized protein n=1 Tax=Fusarium sarcochroum TaxID=1208366 RepID=A0A8H4TVX6_9HYPO|nr:hypothetical protein FSARC_7010 [Fusarium sarcochroum]
MQISIITLALMAVGSVHAALHKSAACVSNRVSSPVGGTPFSPSNNWQTTYEVLTGATECACNKYKQRNTGSEKWDTCPDCTFDGTLCNSAEGHIGGDEFTFYCEKQCGAQGAEAD